MNTQSNKKCGEEASPRPFKNNIWDISESTVWNVIKFIFICLNRGLPKYIKNKMLTSCFYQISSFFKKWRGLELVSLPHFLHDFWRKVFLILYLLTHQITLSGCFFSTSWDIGQYVNCNHLLSSLWRHKYWN